MNSKTLYKSKDQAVIAGVCGGIAEYFDMDKSLVRILFVIVEALFVVKVAMFRLGKRDKLQTNQHANEYRAFSAALLFVGSLQGLELVLSDHVELRAHSEAQLLISHLFFLLAFAFDFFSLFALGLLEGLLELFLLDFLVPLLAHGSAAGLHVVALFDFFVPKFADSVHLVLLWLAQVHRYLLQVQCAVGFVAIRHQLAASLHVLIARLELEVRDGL